MILHIIEAAAYYAAGLTSGAYFGYQIGRLRRKPRRVTLDDIISVAWRFYGRRDDTILGWEKEAFAVAAHQLGLIDAFTAAAFTAALEQVMKEKGE